jgi:hypothetical protein
MFFLICVSIDLADYLLQKLFLIGLRRIELYALSESLAGSAFNESREERIRNTLFVWQFFLKRSWCVLLMLMISRSWFIVLSCSIFKPVLWTHKFVLIWIWTLWIYTISLTILRLRSTNREIFKITALDRHHTSSTCWKNCARTINHTNVLTRLSTFLRRSSFSFYLWLKENFTILVQVKVSNLEVKYHLTLSSSAKFNKSTEEICENLLYNIFI